MSINFKVKDLIENQAPVGNLNTTVREAIKLMIEKKTNFFIVLSEDKKILGVMTLYDILDKIVPYFLKVDTTLGFISTNEILNEIKLKELGRKKVSDLMVKKVYSLYGNDDLIKAIILMYVKNFDYIPVLDENDCYIGLVNRINVEKKILQIINHSH